MVGNRHRSWCFQSGLSAALILRRVPPVPPTRSQTRHSISLKCTIFHTRPGTRHHIPAHCTVLLLFGPHIESLHQPTPLTQPTEIRLVSPVNNWTCLKRHAQGIPQYHMLENWKPVLGSAAAARRRNSMFCDKLLLRPVTSTRLISYSS